MNDKPAFPQALEGIAAPEDCAGLTRRELFAAMAMQGLLHNLGRATRAVDIPNDALTFADALIAELDK